LTFQRNMMENQKDISIIGYKTALEYTQEAIICSNSDGRILWANHSAEKILGLKQQKLVGNIITDVLQGLKTNKGTNRPLSLNHLIKTNQPLSGNSANWINHVGKTVSLAYTIAPFSDENNILGIVVILRELPLKNILSNEISRHSNIDVRKQLKVLVMDDDEMVRNITTRKLIHLGYDAVGTKNGEEAIAKINQGISSGCRFDVMLLDLIIRDGMGGKEAAEKIKKIAPNIKTILTSGYTDDPILTHFWEYGFDGVIRKPFVIKELDRAIFRAMNRPDTDERKITEGEGGLEQ
jgi:PAS domain S-box-containing protein